LERKRERKRKRYKRKMRKKEDDENESLRERGREKERETEGERSADFCSYFDCTLKSFSLHRWFLRSTFKINPIKSV